MDLSVVVPTLNDRDALVACLDAIADHIPGAETIVVNGPSADGTTGAVCARDDVGVLIELADRNVSVARNAGIAAASGDVIALIDERSVIGPDWLDGVESALAAGADAVTGPIRGSRRVLGPERRRIVDREVTYFDGGNAIFTRGALDRLDGFDEYLQVGSARDAAHRVAGLGLRLDWAPSVAVRRVAADRPTVADDCSWKYRSLAYRLAKNYGPRLTVAARTARHVLSDGASALRDVLAGDRRASAWIADGRDVSVGSARGTLDGLLARRRDPRPVRNPHGVSAQSDRAVRRYDWR